MFIFSDKKSSIPTKRLFTAIQIEPRILRFLFLPADQIPYAKRRLLKAEKCVLYEQLIQHRFFIFKM